MCTVENVLLMPMAIFSQMIDLVNIAMRTNQVRTPVPRTCARSKTSRNSSHATKLLTTIASLPRC